MIKSDHLLRLWQIVGDKERGITPLIPVSKSSWWNGVKSGRYPKPVKLSLRTTCWRASDIYALIDQASAKPMQPGGTMEESR
ncbi:MAG: AlpA family phage regulatory protein [Pseudomonadota bacterium]